MKKVNTWLLGLLALLCLAGCGTGETGESGFLFTYNGCTIAMNGAAAPVIAALGEPESYTEAASCAFDGLDKTYGYGSCKTSRELTARIVSMYEKMILPGILKGVCGCVYTQLSDVEEELNGLYTYDREICKVEKEPMRRLAKRIFDEMDKM